MAIIGVQLALQQLSYEYRLAIVDLYVNHVGNERLAEARRQPRGKVANLVRVWKNDVRGINPRNEFLQRSRKAIGSVWLEQLVLNGIGVRQLLPRYVGLKFLQRIAGDCGEKRLAGLTSEMLPGG